MTARPLCRVAKVMLSLSLLSTGVVSSSSSPVARQTASQIFFVRNYAGKCLDFSSPPQIGGTPVIIAACNKTPAQQVQVQEINARHEVVLHVGTRVIGARIPGVTNAAQIVVPSQYALELQTPANPIDPAFRSQVFALDGDSILLAANRNLVAQALNNRGANATPVGVAQRTLADAEFWDFEAVDGSGRDPTSGFIRASTMAALLTAITQVNQIARDNGGAAWGSVIKIVDPGVPIELSYNASVFCAPTAPYKCSYDGIHNRFNVHNLLIPTGVTVRGDRRGTLPGPLLHGNYGCLPLNGHDPCEYDDMFDIRGDDVRITGLRVQGPSMCVLDPDGCHSTNLPYVIGIEVGSLVSPEPARDIVDHNDVFDWTEAGVFIASGLDASDACPGQSSPPPNHALVTRNFLHHNENNDGYGIGIYKGGAATITGNTFLMNRHSISGGDGEPHDQYEAAFNLVLSDVPVYNGNREQDFDMHGTEQPGHWFGGFAGSIVMIHSNTFLGSGRDNFQLRGQPCDGVGGPMLTPLDSFDFNVTMNDSPVLIVGKDGSTRNRPPLNGPAPSSTPYVAFQGNEHLANNPADRLGVGDFDRDGKEDVFLATGTAWYYAPSGTAEWRFLNAQPERFGQLLFGDFDGDGRTDVFTQHGRDWLVSWGGASKWEKINESDARMSDFAVGNFDDDPRADIFYADGKAWYMSSAGIGPFKPLDVSSFRVNDLRFGDFNNDGKTDVFGITGGRWQVEYGAATSWQPLPVTLTKSVAGLVIADFDGDGRADVGWLDCSDGCRWRVSSGGRTPWASTSWPIGPIAAVGHFEGTRRVNVLAWSGNWLDILDETSTVPHSYTRQKMR